MKKIFYNIMILICVGVMLFSGYNIYKIQNEYKLGRDTYAQIASTETTAVNETEEVPVSPIPVVDFESLKQINDESVGWIKIPDSPIDYPMVKGKDNDYYLNHLIDGTYSWVGAIFLDMRSNPDFTDFNTIIYGHHKKDGSMFAALNNYETQEYYDAHPIGYIVLPDGNYEIQFFSGYESDVYQDAWKLEFEEGEKETWLEELIAKSDFKSTVVPTTEDRIVTLSTCSYGFKNARFVVHGVLKKI